MSEEKTAAPADLDGDLLWHNVHERFVAEAKGKEPDVLFIGDDHIQLLEQSEVYRDLLAPLHCLCFGIYGDNTYNLLWRLQHDEIDNIKPKVVVVLVGANNRDPPAGVLASIKEIGAVLRQKQPEAYLIFLKIPPRGLKPNPKRVQIDEVNEGMQEALSQFSNCTVLDIDSGFIASDGTISHQDMYDYFHFTGHGYRKSFELVYLAIQAIISPELGTEVCLPND